MLKRLLRQSSLMSLTGNFRHIYECTLWRYERPLDSFNLLAWQNCLMLRLVISNKPSDRKYMTEVAQAPYIHQDGKWCVLGHVFSLVKI